MGIRIERIKINRGGPLQHDFELESKDVNLIYGHNETGKSYVVEGMISLLFRTGKKLAIDWALRNWGFAGSIKVSGLEENPVTFKRGGRKLDDYWAQEMGLPQDFSRLLVVKEGETALTGAREGANRDVLKRFLSGEELLDKLENEIQATLKDARIQYPEIRGNEKGDIKKWKDSRSERQRFDDLLKKAEEAYTSGTIYDLRQKKESLEAELKRLENAKRYRAKCLHEQTENLAKKKQQLPQQEELTNIDSQISVYEDKRRQADTKSVTLKEQQSVTEDYEWADQALRVYQDIAGGKGTIRPKSLWAILTCIFLAGSILTGFLGFPIPAALCAIVAFGLFLYYFFRIRRMLASAGKGEELERLKEEFKRRFGAELVDLALLRARVEELNERSIRAKAMQEELEGMIWPELERLQFDIATKLKRLTSRELQEQEWREAVSMLREEVNKLDEELGELNRELDRLNVPGEEFLVQDPGIAWDATRYREVREKLDYTSHTLEEEIGKIDNLKYEIRGASNCKSNDWEELIITQRSLCDQQAENYKQVTAEILAKVKLYQVIRELRQEENTRIASGLESKELIDSLYAITGRYKGMRYNEEEGRVLVSDEEEEYPLGEVSTGAREQALLAMRLGFCSMLMKGKSAFLIFDDAFQHSDWPRRSNLVDRIVSIAENGWQVFYFTMDDHIRSLFLEVGEKLGEKYISCELP